MGARRPPRTWVGPSGLLVATLLLAAPSFAAEEPESPNVFEVRSALKGTFLLSRAREVTLFTPDQVSAASFWRLRLEPRVLPAKWITLFAAYEHRARVASSSSALASPGLPPSDATAPFRLVALEGSLSSGAAFSYWHELDRLAVSLHLPRVELTIGRQAIGWGRGMLFGAIDVFAPFTPLEVDREWRRGVDALRADVRLGPKASVELVGVSGPSIEKSAFAGRVRGFLGPVDAELVGGYRAKDWFIGAAASASLFEAEVHGELAVFVLPEPWRWGGTFGNEQRVVAKALLGASYRIPLGDGLTVLAEYHFNGFGLTFPVSAMDLALDAQLGSRLARGDFQILGRHLLAVSSSYAFAMTATVSVMALVDPADGSGVVAPTVNWDLAENVSFVSGVYVGWGRGPQALELRSQLGLTPLTVLVQLRVYDQRNLERRAPEPSPEPPTDQPARQAPSSGVMAPAFMKADEVMKRRGLTGTPGDALTHAARSSLGCLATHHDGRVGPVRAS